MSSKAMNLKVNMNIPVQFLKEGKTFVAYTPALDISTYGSDMNRVRERFTEAVGIFLEEVISKGTLVEVLEDLGWTRKNRTLNPPVLIGSEVRSFDIPQEING